MFAAQDGHARAWQDGSAELRPVGAATANAVTSAGDVEVGLRTAHPRSSVASVVAIVPR